MRAPLCLVGLLAVFWPLAPWYAGRLGDGLEEPWALALLPVLAGLGRPPRSLDLRLTALALTGYALAYPLLPDLLRAALAALTLGAFLSAWRQARFEPGLVGLLVLALPGLSSLQFYLGYPLRAVCAHAAAALLGVRAEGAALVHHGTLVSVDAPCSGLKMLWTGLLLLFLMAATRRWRPRTTLLWAMLVSLALLGGNVLRITSLFLLETGRVPALPWLHEGVGLVVFGLVALLVVWKAPAHQSPGPPGPWRGVPAFLLALPLTLITAALPPATAPPPDTPFPGWPTSFEGRPLRAERVSEAERRFFPGRVGRFTDGQREIILRFVPGKTRKLHSSAECLRGLGYRIRPLPLEGPWSCFEAVRDKERLKVRERIFGDEGSWPDVSQWHWSARQGPWWAVTVAERF